MTFHLYYLQTSLPPPLRIPVQTQMLAGNFALFVRFDSLLHKACYNLYDFGFGCVTGSYIVDFRL